MQTRSIMPSNIALIKYMGKADLDHNLPANTSISLTLPQFHTTCTVSTITNSTEDHWENTTATTLSKNEIEKALKQVARVKEHMRQEAVFLKISAWNNFPMSCGMASSASSMAAITHAVATHLAHSDALSMPCTQTLAELSRMGSGSSCRSFFGPFVRWGHNGLSALSCPIEVQHRIFVLSDEKKRISSSKAHQIISQSPLLKARVMRANERAEKLIQAIQEGAWQSMQALTIADSKDMHSLLEHHDIKYRNQAVSHTFTNLKAFCASNPNFQPITTMDAGPNIHFLLRPQDIALYDRWVANLTETSYATR